MAETYLIALETATEVSSVAVFHEDRLLGSLEYKGGKQHAKLITVMMETLLRDLDLPKKALSAIVIGKGPGSYTGLRVGVSTAKGLAFALDLPLLSINSLEGIAWQVQEIASGLPALICPMIDARRMEVYTAIYDAQGNEVKETEAKIIEKGAYSDLDYAGKLLFAGNGAEKCKTLLEQDSRSLVLTNVGCTARSFGKPAWAKFQAEDFEDLVTFEPFYLKDFVATQAKNPLKTS